MSFDFNLAKKLMRQQVITQKELAAMAGVTEAAMSRYLSGERQPKAETLSNMATALRTTSDALLGKKEARSEIDKAIQLVARNADAIPDSLKRRLIRMLAAPAPDEEE